MISWSTKRKFRITFIVVIIFIIIPALLYWNFYEEEVSCFDNIKNGTEEGIDCGGTCEEICVFKAANLNILLARAFKVTDGVYNLIILIENPNFSYRVKTNYELKVYNEKGAVIYKNQDKLDLFPSEKRAIFIPSVVYKGDKISKVYVGFDPIESLTKDIPLKSHLDVLSKIISEDFGQTKLTVNLRNNSFLPIRKIEVIGILSDKDDNVIQIGKTFVDYLDKKEEKKIFMTWPGSISKDVSIIDIYTKLIN